MITDAFANSSTLPMTLNFISGNQLKVFGLYMGYPLLDYFGSMDRSTRPQSLGWCLFDYVFSNFPVSKYGGTTCVDLVIDSNNAYAKYPDKFEILNEDL